MTQSYEGVEPFFLSNAGLDEAVGCFICGGGRDSYSTAIAGFVRNRASGERIVAMFKQGARLDYRDDKPGGVQVTIGACGTHAWHLRRLRRVIRKSGYNITPFIIQLVMGD